MRGLPPGFELGGDNIEGELVPAPCRAFWPGLRLIDPSGARGGGGVFGAHPQGKGAGLQGGRALVTAASNNHVVSLPVVFRATAPDCWHWHPLRGSFGFGDHLDGLNPGLALWTRSRSHRRLRRERSAPSRCSALDRTAGR